MTAGKFSGVDHDLLADYLGGALDGTPEAATVARLVERDPAWAEAYALLAPAVAQVRADLAGWAEPALQMPLAVTERLTAALAGAGPAPALTTPVDAGTPAGERQQPVPAQSARRPGRTAGAGRDDATGPGRRRRRWARLAAPVALAAASLAAVGLGVDHLLDTSGGGGTAESTVAGGDAASATAPFRVTGAPQTSGTDWTPQTLAGGAAPTALPRVATDGPGLAPGGSTAKSSEADRRPSPGGLLRLAPPDALDACLTEIAAEHGRGAITVELLDYASFQGEPALVLRFADPSGERWAWASGAECGVPGSGADTRYRARVG
ncbi:hypothetical protein KBX37_02080 [Micromonospora sp. U56]|uniref:hypothetical protein n=1 Tax=Micromonospora sp. U56 TaxID=2824900 RepID=UPI001B3588EE|nr:hypothetical protein [Micromonospora sp. U56]MBQ0891900.1 hypothetical protein [Micromonospora sp. U56]